MKKIQIHFFLMDYEGRLHVEMSDYIPRIGEEVRLRFDMFYKVENVVHCFDEKDENKYHRVNIRLSRINENDTAAGEVCESNELLSCPFCGNNHMLEIQHLKGTIIHPAYRVYCDYCGASNGYTDSGNHIKDWNSRR